MVTAISHTGLVIWFLFSVFLIIGVMVGAGLVFLPLLVLLLYVSAISMLIVSGFFVLFFNENAVVTSYRTSPVVTVGSCIFFALLSTPISFFFIGGLSSAGNGTMFNERVDFIAARQSFFFTHDIQCFSTLIFGYSY